MRALLGVCPSSPCLLWVSVETNNFAVAPLPHKRAGLRFLGFAFWAGVAQAEGQANLSREYAQKRLALAEYHKLTELRAEVEAFLKQKK